MSNPFAAFRRYQQALLVIFGILLIFAWTVGGRTSRYNRSAPAANEKDAVAVSWKDGQLTQNGLQQVRRYHEIAVRFVREAMTRAASLGATQQGFPLLGYGDDRNLIRHWILSERAREMGVEISDEAINAWINAVTGNTLDQKQLEDILGEGVSQVTLFEALRAELRALEMRNMLGSGIFPSQMAPSPTVAWDLYNRLQRRLVFEFMPVPVSDFIDQVSEPRESELRELYTQFKERLPDGRTPDPGFKVPLQRAISYVQFNTEEGLKEEMAKVTDAEVQAYYDEHKEDFRITADLDKLLESVNPAGASTGEGAPSAPAAATPPTTPPSAETAPPAETGPPAETPPATPPATEPAPSEAPAATNPSSGASESAPVETPSGSGCGGDEATEPNDDAPTPGPTDPPSGDPAPTDPPPSDPPATDPPAEAAAPTTAPSETAEGTAPVNNTAEPAAEVTSPAPEVATAPEAGETKPEAAPAAGSGDQSGNLNDLLQPPTVDPSKQETPQYQPLEKVVDQVRNAIAAPRLAERVSQALTEVVKAMDEFYQKHLEWEINRESDPKSTEPRAPDMAELAKKLGLKFEALPLMDGNKFYRDHEVGRAIQFVPSGERFAREPLVQKAFGAGVQLYRPVKFGNPGFANEYVFWATQEMAEHVPEFSECHDAVVRAWRMSRAVELARKKAQEYAEEAKTAKKTLVEQFVGQNRSVFQPDPEQGISWMTVSTLPVDQGGGIYLSPVPDMEYAGWNTLHDIFRLNPGEYGVTVNQPKSIVYVVHVKGEKTSDTDRRNRYLSPATAENILYLSMQERSQVVNQQLEHLEEELGLKWHTTPKM